MSNRLDYYYKQKVTEAELDQGFDYLETADRAQFSDLALFGVCSGGGVTQQSIADLTVQVAASTGYDQTGQRIRVPSTQNANCAVDYNAVSTSVVTGGNEKWVSIYVGFARALSDPRTDGNAATVYFQRAESFALRVVQGAEAPIGTATKPALDSARILLADVRLINGQTQILNADISTARAQRMFLASAGGISVAALTPLAAVQAVVTELNNHITGVSNLHVATAVNYAGGAAWADGTTNPAATVEVQLDKVISDLGAGAGTAKIHGAATVATWKDGAVLAAGTLAAQIEAIVSTLGATTGGTKIGYNGGGTWADGTTNPTTSVEAQLDKIVSDLAATSGAPKVGSAAHTASLVAHGTFNLTAGSVRSQLTELANKAYDLKDKMFPFGANAGANIFGFIDNANFSGTGSKLKTFTAGLGLACLFATAVKYDAGTDTYTAYGTGTDFVTGSQYNPITGEVGVSYSSLPAASNIYIVGVRFL